MTAEDLVKWLLGGGLITSLAALWQSRHRPRVDQAQLVIEGNTSLVDNLQEERDALKAERTELKAERQREREEHGAKIREQDAKIEALTERVVVAEEAARDAKQMTTYAVAENANLVGYIIATAEGIVARRVPPWIDPAVYGLHGRLTLDDLPAIHLHHDTGVPGVDLNPPPEE